MDNKLTKEELLEGILKLHYSASIDTKTALKQIKLFTTDDRLEWKP